MAIPAQNPTTVPAVSAKSFPDLWLYNINIYAPAVNSGRIYIEALPYNPDVQEIGPATGLEVITTNALFEVTYDVPEVGIAYQAIIDAIVPLREWIAARNNPVIPGIIITEPDPVVIPTEPEPEPVVITEPDPVVIPTEPEPEPVVITEPDPAVITPLD
jgi:hypothetical protein